MKQYYHISEISKLYQIGPDSLRYYEELGLLRPKRGKNHYRLYSLEDLWRLNVIRDLRLLGFSMEKIHSYIDRRSISSTFRLMEEEKTMIQKKLNELQKLYENVCERLETLESALSQPLETVQEKTFPSRPCHTIMAPYRSDEEMDMLIKKLVNLDTQNLYIIGNNRIGSFLPLQQAENGCFDAYEGVFLIDRKGNSQLEAGTYLSISYRGDSHQNRQYFPHLLEYARCRNLILEGPVLEILWVDIHQSADFSEHITELQILIRN